MKLDDILTIPEASARCGISKSAIRAAIQRGKLFAVAIGKKPIYMVSVQDIDAYKARTHGKPGRPRKEEV